MRKVVAAALAAVSTGGHGSCPPAGDWLAGRARTQPRVPPEQVRAGCSVGTGPAPDWRAWTRPGGMMGRQVVNALYLLTMVVIVVGLDILFFRNHFWERLAVNLGTVLVFVAFYFRFLGRR